MNVTLRQITDENLEAIVSLNVREDQVYLASNLDSIKQTKKDPDDIAMAIYDDTEPVGFVMYSLDYDDSCLWISRLMIDRNYQGKGYGTAALQLLKNIAMSDFSIDKMALSTPLANVEGIKFYTKFGFVDTNTNDGEENPEEIFELQLEK